MDFESRESMEAVYKSINFDSNVVLFYFLYDFYYCIYNNLINQFSILILISFRENENGVFVS